MGVLNDGMDPNGAPAPEGTPNEGQPEGGGSPPQAERPKWKAQVRDDLKESELLDQYTDLNALAEAQLNYLNGKGDELTVPADDDSEAWAKLYEKLGRPTEKSQYELTTQEKLEGTEEFSESFKEAAHEAGLTQRQAQALFSSMVELARPGMEAMKELGIYDTQKCTEILRKDWGDRYEAKVADMNKGVKQFADREYLDLMDKLGLSDHPAVCKTWAKVGAKVANDKPPERSEPGPLMDIPFDYPSMKES